MAGPKFPMFSCPKCKGIRLCVRLDPPNAKGQDAKCETCGDTFNNYMVEKGKIVAVPFAEMVRRFHN